MNNKNKRVRAWWQDRIANYVYILEEYRPSKPFLFFWKTKAYWKNLMVSTSDKNKANRWCNHYEVNILYLD